MQRSRIERTSSKKWRGSIRRIISAAIYNLSCFGHGCSAAWAGGALGGGGWLAALPAAPFLALLADAKGRRAGAFAVCVCFIVSGCLCAWSTRAVWAGRAAAGAGGAGALALAPLYCAEIAPGNRGLAAMPALATSCGILFAFTAGPLLSSQALPLWMALPPTVLMISLLWLPETPSFLISVGRMQDAAKVLCWLNGSDFREDLTDVIEEQEVRIRTNDCYGPGLSRSEDDTFEPMLQRTADSTSDRKGDTSSCRELFFQRRNRRALFSLCVLLCVAAGSGVGAVSSFAASLLRDYPGHTPLAALALDLSDNRINYNNSSIAHIPWHQWPLGPLLCSGTLVLGAAIALITVDKIGRKMLLISSCSGLACCLAILGAYCDPRVPLPWTHFNFWTKTRPSLALLNNHSEPFKGLPIDTKIANDIVLRDTKALNQNLTQNDTFEIYSLRIDDAKGDNDNNLSPTIILVSMVLFLYNLGLGSMPYVLVTELFSLNVRSFASGLLIFWMWLISFLLLRYFGSAAIYLGLHGIYYLGSAITFLGSLFIFFTIPETKGKSQVQIDEMLRGTFFLCRNENRKNRDVPRF